MLNRGQMPPSHATKFHHLRKYLAFRIKNFSKSSANPGR